MGRIAKEVPASVIEKWSDWPEDVGPKLREWNAGRRLSFRGTRAFQCPRCEFSILGNRYGNAVLDGSPICDDCLIDEVRYSGGGTADTLA